MAVDLPPEIFHDILLRFDVRELCKFRCVSKLWKNLISDPSFVHSHMQQSMKKPHLFLKKRGRKLLTNPTGPLDIDSLMQLMRYDDERFCGIKPQFPEYLCRLISIRPFNRDNFSARGGGGFMLRQHQNPFDLECDGFNIISCCSGLVLLSICFERATRLRLMNPVNSRIIELPIIYEPYVDNRFGCHRSSCYCLVYSNSEMEFKVVRFFPARDGYGSEVLIFNDSPKWTRLHEDNIPIAWLIRTTITAGGSQFFESSKDLILEFEVGTNKVSLVNNPPGWDHDLPRDFIEINGELGMSNRENTRKTKVIEIWILKDKENSVWVNTYSIKVRERPNEFMIIPIYFVDEDTWFIECSGSVFMCDRSGCHFQEIASLYESWHCFYWENLSLL